MPFWDHESTEERQRRDAEAFGIRTRRTIFNRRARKSVQERGIDPDTVPSLRQSLDTPTTVGNLKEASGRAQALGVSMSDYQRSTPKQREALASYKGHEYTQRQARQEHYTDEQIALQDRIDRRAKELLPEGLEAPHYDDKGAIIKSPTYDEEYDKATQRAVKELDWSEVKELSPGGGILEVFGTLLGSPEQANIWAVEQLGKVGLYEEREVEQAKEAYEAGEPLLFAPFEEGAKVSRPVVEAVLDPVGLEDTVAEDILTEVINPAAIVLVAPLAGQGIKVGSMSARAMAAKMTSNLLGTGMEPEMVRGTLRAASNLRRHGVTVGKVTKGALGNLPEGWREVPMEGAPELWRKRYPQHVQADTRVGNVTVQATTDLEKPGIVYMDILSGQDVPIGDMFNTFREVGRLIGANPGRTFRARVTNDKLRDILRRAGIKEVSDMPDFMAARSAAEQARLAKRFPTFEFTLEDVERFFPQEGGVKAALDRIGGFTQRARTKPLRGGPPTPTIQEYQRHRAAMTTAKEGAEKQVGYIREEVSAGRMDARAMDEATARLADARTNLRTSKTDLDTAIFKNAREEILVAARESGVHDERVLDLIAKAFDNSVARVPAEEVLMNAGGARNFFANAAAHITGTPPGVVGRLAHHRDILLSSLRRHSFETADPIFDEIDSLLLGRRSAGTLGRRTGGELGNIHPNAAAPKKWRLLLEGELKPSHIIQHPEWFEGMSPALMAKMDEAQTLMLSRLETAKALGYPIEPVKTGGGLVRPLDQAYLEQLWEIPHQAVGAHYLPGRVSVAKPKLFDDYLKGITQGYTPKPMTPGELMKHSMGLLDQANADAWMKQEIIRRFGSKHPGKVAAGRVKFQHALYKDWYGPAPISSWLDEMEAPVGRRLRQVSNVSAAFRGTVFGLTDIAVSGVQFPLSLAHGGLQMGVGSLNRSLQQLHAPHFHLYLQDETFLGRAVDAVENGLELTWGPSSVQRKGGTVLQYVPGLDPVEKVVSGAVDAAAQAQFGYALSGVRLRMYEGNLIALKMAGENIFDPKIRKMAAEWANSSSGASRGPMVKGRRAAESTLLTSVQMTRANLSVYGQMAKAVAGIGTRKAGRAEVLRAAMTLANLGATVYGIQYLFNEVLGDGPMEWVPGRSDWATIRIGGRTVPIIPQRSILRGIDKSIKILSEEVGASDTDRYSLSDLAMAWSQVAVGKASPLVGVPVGGLLGYGFEPGTGKFEMGGLSTEGRVVSALPIPPLVEQAGWQERDELSLAIAGLGFNPYDTSSGVLLREEFTNKFGEELNWESPAHREDIESNKRLAHLWEKSRSESREYGSEAAITSEEIRQEIADGEKDKGMVRLAEAVESGDPFAMANWKDQRSEFLIWRSGKWDNKLTGREPRTEIGKLVNEYYSIDPKDPKYTDSSGNTDWSAFSKDREDVLDRMPQADADAIRGNEKFADPTAEKVDKQFRAAQEKLRPFWDVEEKVWGQLRLAHEVLRPYGSLKELEEEKAAELIRQGVPQEELRWRLNRVPILTEVGSIINQARFNFRLRNPEIDALLVKWYGNTPADERIAGKPRRPPKPARPGRV